MRRSPFCVSWLVGIGAILATTIAPSAARAKERNDHGDRGRGRPVYQRHAFDWSGTDGRGYERQYGRAPQFGAPQASAGWFQRPYPYHLDYYKMRYGGSYAPYFGNLYGPPQVVTAPPYYGPYYGGGEYGYPIEGGYHGGYPDYPHGMIYEAPIEKAAPMDQPTTPTNGDRP